MPSRIFYQVIAFVLLALGANAAAVPAPDQLLPGDTVAVLTIPDFDRATTNFQRTGVGQLILDPAMKAFNEKFATKFSEHFIKPFERELGFEFGPFRQVLRGQITLALTPAAANQSDSFGFLLLVDARDRAEVLKTNLAALKSKWSGSGHQSSTNKIRDVEFTTVTFTEEDWDKLMEKAFPAPPGEEKKTRSGDRKYEISFGQSDSLLIVGDNPKDIEKVLARQNGGAGASLAEQAAFQTNKAGAREATAYGWLNFAPVYEHLRKSVADSVSKAAGGSDIDATKLLKAAGLAGVKSVAFKLNAGDEGISADAFIATPDAERAGIFKLLAPQKKESAPPPFVPADVVKFSRLRISGSEAWNTLEGMLMAVSPQMVGFLQLALSAAGKDKDPNFDLRTALLGSLGDDFISIERAPKTATESSSSLLLIGSPNPEKLLDAVKALTSLLPIEGGSSAVKDREIEGRKVFAVGLGDVLDANGKKVGTRTFNFAAAPSYLAISSEVALLEEFLKKGDVKPLRDVAALNDAAQKIGGMTNGFFSYDNQVESARIFIEALKADPAMLDKMISGPVGSKVVGVQSDGLKDWIDASLLPGFDKIAKYFSITVISGQSTPEGIAYRAFSPNSAALKK